MTASAETAALVAALDEGDEVGARAQLAGDPGLALARARGASLVRLAAYAEMRALVADLLSPAVAGRGTGTSAVYAASTGTALTLLTAAGASVALYLLALRHLSGPAPLHTDETGGRGPAVVFVHGLGASGRYWDAVVPRLAGRRTVTVDLLGFGRSPKPRRASYDVDFHADALAPHVPGRRPP